VTVTTRDNRPCPRDRTPLKSHRHTIIGAWLCSACRGLWLPGATVEKALGHVADSKHVAVGATAAASPLACPEDGASMAALKYRGVEVDLCPQCHGVWLDRGELQHVTTGTALGGLGAVAPTAHAQGDALGAGDVLLEIIGFLAQLFIF